MVSLTHHPESASVPMAAKYLLRTKGAHFDALGLAVAENAPPRVVSYLKATVGAGLTSNASELADREIANKAFFESLAHSSVFFAGIETGFVRIPLRARVVLISALGGGETAEGAAKPLSRLDLNQASFVPRKASSLLVISNELADSMSAVATNLVIRELRKGVIAAVDAALFSELASDTGTVSLLSSGTTAPDAGYDLRQLLMSVPSHQDGKFLFVASSTVAKAISTLQDSGGAFVFPEAGAAGGGTLLNTPFMVSDAVGADELWLIDLSGIVAAAEDVQFEMARHAAIEMDDSPSHNSTTPTPTQLISLWQNNCVGLRAEVRFSVEKVRPDCAAVLTGIAWGSLTT